MDENQSRTDAHKVFGQLYRKERTPEHQAKIDEEIKKSNDIFIRIDLIKKIDEDFEHNRNKEREPSNNTVTSKSTVVTKKPNKAAPSKLDQAMSDSGKSGGGFFSSLFGFNSEINKFAKETDTINVSIFGRKLTLKKTIEKVFKQVREDQIISTLQALKLCEQQGWRVWSPLVYNVIVNFNKFFTNFTSLDSLFLEEISTEVFIKRSTKMQVYYARVLSRNDTKQIVLENVQQMVNNDEKLALKLPLIVAGLNHGLNLENQHPRLTEVIRAFYIVTSKKMISWDEVVKLIGPPPIDATQFQGAQEVAREVELSLSKLKDDIAIKINKQEEIKSLKERYFALDNSGRVSFDFINEIIDDYFERHLHDTMQAESLKSSYKSTPHKLLHLLFRDFQAVYSPILEGVVRIGTKNQNKDVIIFQPGLFKQEVEETDKFRRMIDEFNKKFPSFQYSFQDFNSQKGADDQITAALYKIFKDSSEFLGKFATRLNILMENHLLAKEYESKGKTNERLTASKEKVIEDFKVLHRFLPYYDLIVVSSSRNNGLSIEVIFANMVKSLYNYAVLFRDKATLNYLYSNKKIEAELKALMVEYERLAGKPYSMEETKEQ